MARKEVLKHDPMPPELKEKDFKPLIEMCINHLYSITKSDYCEDNDDKHYIYEAAITAIFGGNIWNWINKQT